MRKPIGLVDDDVFLVLELGQLALVVELNLHDVVLVLLFPEHCLLQLNLPVLVSLLQLELPRFYNLMQLLLVNHTHLEAAAHYRQ